MSTIKNLETIRQTLKNEFVGVDKQIDRIINLITPWYIHPELLEKPIIINLWGMTGSGKTSIVRRLSELLGCANDFCEIDLGKFTGADTGYESIFRQANKLSNKKSIFLIDEIQTARTVGRDEIDRPALRDLWSFLNDGKVISPIYGDFIVDDLFSIFLEKEDNELTYENLDEYMLIEISSRFKVDLKSTEIQKKLKGLSGKLFIKNLLEVISKSSAQKTEDFSKSLVFVAGNLDEAFLHAKNVDYDMLTTDELFKSTSKINTIDIKEALLKRFRAEQVSRLGYNHVIFNSLSKKDYNKILENYILRTKNKIKSKSKIKVSFSKKLKNFLLEEGIVATQGVRAFESTYSSLINSRIPHIVTYAASYKATEVLLEYNEVKHDFFINFIRDGKRVYSIKDSVMFEMNKKRNDLHPEPMRSYVAYHEAGHAVVGYLVFDKLPTMIRSKLADSNVGGVVKFDTPEVLTKKDILNEITCLYGGMAAEKLIFGKENISIFSSSDLQQATKEASDALRLYGMGQFLGVSENDQFHPENLLSQTYVEENDNAIEDILQECFNRAEDLLIMNADFHKEVAEVLKKRTHLTAKEFKQIAQKYEGAK